MSRWVIWPEPDLPRTSTGKVRRKAVAEWLGTVHAASTNGNGGAHKNGTNGHKSNGNGANGNGSNGHSSNGQSSNGHSSNGHATHTLGASTDWLLTMIAQVSGESPAGVGDKLRITEDLHLDSLGRVQLAAAIEERTGIALEARNGSFDHAQTLGDLRLLLDSEPMNGHGPHAVNGFKAATTSQTSGSEESLQPASEPSHTPELTAQPSKRTADNLYPHWPWWSPIHWARVAFLELVLRPLVWLLANPRVNVDAAQKLEAPMLIVANHVTAFDGPLLEYALPGPIRRRMAVAMSGEMLTAYRRFRNLQPARPTGRFFLPGPLYYFLVTALFNVFPLPRQRDFQRSFAHAGQALDAGFNVMVFPEGARSAEGHMAKFRPGIGMLVKQSRVPVLPMAMRGLGDLKARGSGWFRSGKIEVRVGQPIRFGPLDSEPAITARLQEEVGKLLEDRE
jgi:long-chain acyl-CoA synthetase